MPIVIDKDNVIVSGHTRYLAAKELGLKKVPAIMADDLTEDQIKAFRIIDNKTGEKASWDFAKLSDEIDGLDLNINLIDFGFGEFELDVLKNGDEILDESEFDFGAPAEGTGTDDGSYSVSIRCENEEEKEWLTNILCVDSLKRTYKCSELMGVEHED